MANLGAGIAGGLLLGLGAGIGVGVAIAVFGPRMFPEAAANARPLAKKALREALAAYERGREVVAELGEYADDMLAEIKSDVAMERMREASAAMAAAAAARSSDAEAIKPAAPT